MKLLVGLGNLGQQYRDTRHNVGFRFLDYWAEAHALSFSKNKNVVGEVAEYHLDSNKIMLLKPQTFMNHSGKSVALLAHYYNIEVQDIIVIYDDLDLEPGKFRLKKGGGHGGHNGLKSLHQHLGQSDYVRIKLGIGRPDHGEISAWVLGKMTTSEVQCEQHIFDGLLKEISAILSGDLAGASNRIHLHLN